jgi:hypothetical protein
MLLAVKAGTSITIIPAAIPVKKAAAAARAGCCNIAIGNLRDDPVIIQAALDYVRLHHDRIACIPPAASRATQPLPRKFTKDVT